MLATTLDLQANPFLSTLKRVDAAVAGFHGRLVTFSAAFTGISAAANMVAGAFAKFGSVLNLGGQLTDLSAGTGEAVGELLVAQTAFKNAGKEGNALGGFISKLHKAIGGLNEEGKATSAAFGELSTSAEALRGVGINEQISILSKGFAGIEDPARRGQVAMALFGKSGEELLAVFRDPEAISTARTQVGGLAGTMEKLAPTLDVIGDAIGGITLKFQQLTAGALSVIAPQTLGFADALNKLDLTNVGIALGYVAKAVIVTAQAVQFALPVVASLGAGWLASMALTQAASIGIVAAVRSVVVATVSGIRTIMVALGPVGLAVAGLTYLWQKFRKTEEDAPAALNVPTLTGGTAGGGNSAGANFAVSNLTKSGLNAFSGGGMGGDPLVARADKTNALLQQMLAALSSGFKVGQNMFGGRPDLPV